MNKVNSTGDYSQNNFELDKSKKTLSSVNNNNSLSKWRDSNATKYPKEQYINEISNDDIILAEAYLLEKNVNPKSISKKSSVERIEPRSAIKLGSAKPPDSTRELT